MNLSKFPLSANSTIPTWRNALPTMKSFESVEKRKFLGVRIVVTYVIEEVKRKYDL